MFFTVSPLPDPRLPEHDNIGSWWFSHDAGWSSNSSTWTKGSPGNYLTLTFDTDRLDVAHDLSRCFPIWWNQNTKTLSNFLGTGDRVWADQKISVVDGQLLTSSLDVAGSIGTVIITRQQAVDAIIANLIQKIKSLQQPCKLFVTGGIDTLTLLALVKHTATSCEILDYEHFEYDKFTNENINDLKKQYWAYNQIHHWRQPTTLISGAYGDEFLFRGPHNIALWAAWHDIEINKIIKANKGYHVGYFCKPENEMIFQSAFDHRSTIKLLYPNYVDLVRKIIDTNANDFQHCHLGNTITWTPFKDSDLTKVVMQLGQQDLLEHIIDATVNKQIIACLYPKALTLLSATKNYNSRQFLHMLHEI